MPSTSERFVLGLIYLMLVGAAVMSAVIECFLVPQRLPHGIEGVSVALALVGNFGLGILGGFGAKALAAVIMPALTWLMTVLFISAYAPGGDVILPGVLPTDPGVTKVTYGFLMAGIFASAVAAVLTFRYTNRADQPTSPV